MAETNMRERVAELLNSIHFDGTQCGSTKHPGACSNCFGPSPMDAREIADAILPLIEEAVTAERERCARVINEAVSPCHDYLDTVTFWNIQAELVAAIQGGEGE